MNTYIFITLLLLSACTSIQYSAGPPILISHQHGTVPMLQSVTGNGTTHINILAGQGARWSFKISPDTSLIEVKEIRHPPSLHKIYKLSVKGLKPNTRYTLTVFNRNGNPIDERFFATFPQDKSTLRFAFGSCMNDGPAFREVSRRIWRQVEKSSPDLILLMGDNVYADEWHFLGKKILPRAHQIWQRYVLAFDSIPLFRFKHLIPTLTTWDDHDYGQNNGDKNWGTQQGDWNPVAEATKAFHAFFHASAHGTHYQKGPGVSSRVDVAGHRFIFLDNRTFRTPDDIDFGHWGAEQEAFLFKQMQSTRGPLFLINGGQFFGGYLIKESLEYNHPTHFQGFKKRIQNLYQNNPQLPPFVLLSGDVHFSEIMQIEKQQFGRPTYEFTSSPWHNRIRKVHSDPKYASRKNTRRIKSIQGPNFLLAQSRYQENVLKLNVTAYGPKGKIRETPLSLEPPPFNKNRQEHSQSP